MGKVLGYFLFFILPFNFFSYINFFMEYKSKNIDGNGFLWNGKDYGDSCFFQHHWMFIFDCYLSGASKMYEKSPGRFARSPYNYDWTGEKDRMSRDQAISVAICLAKWDRRRLWSFCWRHLLRGGFLWNTRRNGATAENHNEVYKEDGRRRNYNWKFPDWCGFEFFGIYIRGFGISILDPILDFLDMETYFGTLFLNENDETDLANHLIYLLYARDNRPNYFSYLALNSLSNTIKDRQLKYWCSKGRPCFVGEEYKRVLEEL